MVAGKPVSSWSRASTGDLSFLALVWGDYWIVALDGDYHWAVVGERSRKYLWIQSRTRTLGAAVNNRLLAEAAGMGFDVMSRRCCSRSSSIRPAVAAAPP